MKALALFRLALAGGLIAACGPSPTPVGQVTSPSPSASASAIASPTPASGVCDASHRCLAVVTLRGSNNVVVRDITDLMHPTTVANLGPISVLGGYGEAAIQFVSASKISYPLNGGVVTTPLSGSPRTPVAGTAKEAGAPIWSPDGKAFVYVTQGGSYDTDDVHLDVHLWRAGVDRVVGTTPGLGMGDCQTISNCTMANWLDSRMAFSSDGRFFSFVAQGFGPSFIFVWSSDGTLLTSDKTKPTTMSTWSTQGLYFRDGSGVEEWHDGVISKFLPNVFWIKPSASPGGGRIVFTVRDSAGWGQIWTVDTASKQLLVVKIHRTDAVFLTSRYIWYQGERACTAAERCGSKPPFHPLSGTNYIYDLQTGKEYSSIITGVADVWPHAA